MRPTDCAWLMPENSRLKKSVEKRRRKFILKKFYKLEEKQVVVVGCNGLERF
jgi:hypothetical protein